MKCAIFKHEDFSVKALDEKTLSMKIISADVKTMTQSVMQSNSNVIDVILSFLPKVTIILPLGQIN